MKNYGSLLIIIILLAIVFIGGNQFFTHESPKDSETVVLGEQQNDVVENQSYTLEIPEEWSENIGDNISIEAKIMASEEVKENGFFKTMVKEKEFPTDQVLSFFETPYHLTFLRDDGNGELCYEGEEECRIFVVQGDNEDYRNSAYMTTEYAGIIWKAYKSNPIVGNQREYKIGQNLEGFSIAQASAMVEDFLNALQKTEDTFQVYWSLDYNTMERLGIELLQDGGEKELDYNWSETDNSYHVNIWQKAQGVPVLDSAIFEKGYDILTCGTTQVYLNEKGIYAFYEEETLEMEQLQQREELLEFSEVMDQFRNAMNILNLSDEITISEIQLRALPVKEGNEKRLAPVWIFKANVEVAYDDIAYTHCYYYVLDGVTGEVLR